MNILFINGSPNSNGNTAALAKELLQGKEEVIVIGSPLYWHNICGSVRNILDRFYGLVENGSLSGRTLYFLFQGAAPEKWMLEAGEYTMKRFAGLYGMKYAGMATNHSEAAKLSKKLSPCGESFFALCLIQAQLSCRRAVN